MSGYLFGSVFRGRAIGMIDDVPVLMQSRNGQTIVTLGEETITFDRRQDAIQYLRWKASQGNKSRTGAEQHD